MILIYIRKASTGEVRTYPSNDDWCEYHWGMGNYGCDCNRHLFFERADGKESDCDQECGETEYLIDRVVAADGKSIIYEGDPRS